MPLPSISLSNSFGNKVLVLAVSLFQFANFVLFVFVSFFPFCYIKRNCLHVFTHFFILVNSLSYDQLSCGRSGWLPVLSLVCIRTNKAMAKNIPPAKKAL